MPLDNSEPVVSTLEELARVLRDAPEVPMNWHRYGIALAEAGHIEELLALTDRAAPKFGSGVRFIQNIVLHFAGLGRWEAIRTLSMRMPRHRLESAVAVYFRGCEKVAAGDHAAALEIFDEFKQLVLPNHGSYPIKTDKNFNVMFRQGTLVEGLEKTGRILADPVVKTPPEQTVAEQAATNESTFVIAISVDARYFRRFAPVLCRGYAEMGVREPLHFHVVAPQPDSFELFDQMKSDNAGLNLGLSFEESGPWRHPVYYTCARFFAIERLLPRYGLPVLALDADILPKVPPGVFVEHAGNADFACIDTGRNEPASVYQASVMYFPDRPETLDFISLLQRFVASKLDKPPFLTWMLDQAAMYSVLAWLAKTRPSFRFTDLGKAMGQGLSDVTRQLSTEAEKHAIMNNRQ